jgi:hypothetical protein
VRWPLMGVELDAAHGGRWTSIRGRSGREWLWQHDIPGRDNVHPGDTFVDAGGLEECLPTIAGVPDHGEVWSRPWMVDGDVMSVRVDDYQLIRRIDVNDHGITATYRLYGEPGWPFIWAGHTLLDVSSHARLMVPLGRHIWVNDPAGTTTTRWPFYRGTDLSHLGENDGTALMILLPELTTITVSDGDDIFVMSIRVEEQPSGIAIWRNLGGWPEGKPYRSVGVEPMLGYSPTLSLANEGEAAVVPPSGVVEWTMTIDG